MSDIILKRAKAIRITLSLLAIGFLVICLYQFRSSVIQTSNKQIEKSRNGIAVHRLLASNPASRPKKESPSKDMSTAPELYSISHAVSFEILSETYADDDELTDEYWDESEYVTEQRNIVEQMSDQKLDDREFINSLESQLISTDYIGQFDDVTRQLEMLYLENDESNPRLVDVHCVESLCRIVLEVPDVIEQHRALVSMQERIDWIQEGYAQVQIQPNDSRFLTVYLIRPEMEPDWLVE